MRVRVLFFALYRDLAGRDELVLELPAGSSARNAVNMVREAGADLARLPEQPAVAINEEFARLDATLADGDVVALLPPVAGG